MAPELPATSERRRLVIGLDDLEESASGVAPPNQPAPAPPLPPVPSTPGRRVTSSRSGYDGPPRPPGVTMGDVALGGAALLVRLGIALLAVLAIGGFVYGGTDDAHQRCLAHRLGAPGIIGTVACVVEH